MNAKVLLLNPIFLCAITSAGAISGAVGMYLIPPPFGFLPLAIGLIIAFLAGACVALEDKEYPKNHVINGIVFAGGFVTFATICSALGYEIGWLMYQENHLPPDELKRTLFGFLLIGSIIGSFVGYAIAESVLELNVINGDKNTTVSQILCACFNIGFLALGGIMLIVKSLAWNG